MARPTVVHHRAAIAAAPLAQRRGVDRRADARDDRDVVQRLFADREHQLRCRSGRPAAPACRAIPGSAPTPASVCCIPHERLRVPSAKTSSASPRRDAIERDLDALPRDARDFARMHHRVLARQRGALRRLDRAEAQAREPALQARVDLRAGDDRQPVGDRASRRRGAAGSRAGWRRSTTGDSRGTRPAARQGRTSAPVRSRVDRPSRISSARTW